MKFSLMALLTACVLFVSTNVFAFTVPTPTGHVTDTAHKLSSSQLADLNSKAEAFERETKNELAVLITATLDGDNVEDVAYKTFNTWGVGKKGLDNGVLLVLAVKEHKSRIETGKGVGGELTDVQTQDILVSMRAFLRKDDFYGAVNWGMLEIKSKLDTRRAAKAEPGQGARFNQPVVSTDSSSTGNAPSCSISSTASDVGYGFGLVAFFAVAVLLTVRYLIRSRKREEAELQAEMDRRSSLYLPLPVTATAAAKPKQTLTFPRTVPKVTELPGAYRRSYPANPTPIVPSAPKPKAKAKPKSSSYDSGSSSSSSSSYSSGSSYDGGSSSGGGFGGGDSGGGGSSSDW